MVVVLGRYLHICGSLAMVDLLPLCFFLESYRSSKLQSQSYLFLNTPPCKKSLPSAPGRPDCFFCGHAALQMCLVRALWAMVRNGGFSLTAVAQWWMPCFYGSHPGCRVGKDEKTQGEVIACCNVREERGLFSLFSFILLFLSLLESATATSNSFLCAILPCLGASWEWVETCTNYLRIT